MIRAAQTRGKHARPSKGLRVSRYLVVALFAAVAPAVRVNAQPARARPSATPPCCAISGIDIRRAVVTAQEASTGHVFRFEVPDRTVLGALKVGQKVWADFATAKVTLDPKTGPCCRILPDRKRPASGAAVKRGDLL